MYTGSLVVDGNEIGKAKESVFVDKIEHLKQLPVVNV